MRFIFQPFWQLKNVVLYSGARNELFLENFVWLISVVPWASGNDMRCCSDAKETSSIEWRIQSGAAGWGKGFVTYFLRVPQTVGLNCWGRIQRGERLKNRLGIRLRLNFDSMTCLNYIFFDFFQYRKSQADSQADFQAVFPLWIRPQLPYCPSKQGELPENMLQNILLNLPPQTVVSLESKASN